MKFSDIAMVDNAMESGTLIGAAIAGLIAASIATAFWLGLSMATGQNMDYFVIGTGLVTGLAVRVAGGGTSMPFGLVGMALTLMASIIGEYCAVIMKSTTNVFDFYGVMVHLNITDVGSSILMKASLTTFVFYGVALLLAYLISVNRIVKN